MSHEEERRAHINDVIEQLDRVKAIHGKLLRKEPLKDTDRMIVARLIRRLVEEWV